MSTIDLSDEARTGIVDLLNELLLLDPVAIAALVEHRVSCNKALADHPTVQVRALGCETYTISLLGIINGIAGTQPEGARHPGWGFIAGEFGEVSGKLIRFVRIDGKAGDHG
ncbi:MAG: hypothetical protein WC683_16160 [bacterium]